MSPGSTSREEFLRRLEHEPDPFQTSAMDSLDAGASVLVAAPTGSGKTLVAEYAVALALAAGKRAFYTTPIKALSNQKHRDFGAQIGEARVGLVTGDNSVNSDAPLVVMTTEVLRNMIYTRSERLDDLAVVVLDEVHYLQDAYRGPVWEEVIIQLPPEVQLVCLSATVSNADEVAEWLSTVRGRTDAVVERTRPVELVTHFAFRDASTGRVEMHDTIVGGEPNRHLQRTMAVNGRQTGRGRGGGPKRRFTPPSRTDVVDLLESSGMLPAIVFIFSRAQCEDAVRSCAREGIVLTTAEEEDEILDIVSRHCASLGDDDRDALGYADFAETVSSGVACHHAGMIPMFKEAVEQCFVRGLVKVVFATETLAVGINMPARAVVIEKLTKYTGEHHALLRASEYTQLTGRAGRRGLDEIGHAITLWSPWVGFDQVAGLALSRSFRLSSAFRPTYNMAVNMVANHSREGAEHLLNLSFAQFQADRDVVTTEALLEKKRRELAALERARQDEIGTAAAGEHDATMTETPAGDVEAEIALRALRPGDVVVFDAANLRGRGLVLSTASRRSGMRLTVLSPSRKILDVTAKDLRSLPVKAARVDLPTPFEPARSEFVREAAARLVRARVDETAVSRAVEHSGRRMDAPVDSARVSKRLRRDIEQMENRVDRRSGSVSGRFMDVVTMLEEMGYIDDWELLQKGELLSRIFHESDLLIVEVLSSKVLDQLAPRDLVTVLSALVFEPRGNDEAAVRWPNDTVRHAVRRIDKISARIHEREADRGITRHRAPHAGIVWEISAWASGRALSRIIDDELTPGDFVRTVRQLVDLLRQISVAAPNEALRESASAAVGLVDRGVVAAAGSR